MANRLIHEKSPYLLQHAENPVDWFPWSDEAFIRAQEENRPLFLSIGYSTCHWCHVMERESFEDPEVADLMNRVFVSIKVDREERPDIDGVYMQICQMLTGSGGWPLTIIMTPDRKPFFAGTYFPRESRLGRIGMLELILRVESLWQDRRQDIQQITDKVMQSLETINRNEDMRGLPEEGVLDEAYRDLAGSFDDVHGGFGSSPKFPSPSNLLFLLRYARRHPSSNALSMVVRTLKSMRMGGIYDQLGYGFHRYATDRNWIVPHFEKMLYDQALLMMAFTEAFQVTGEAWLGDTVKEIFSYVSAWLTAPVGGFYSAEDADTEGEEGLFYLWSVEEVESLLGKEDAGHFIEIYNMERSGNYLEEATRRRTGRNILYRKDTDEARAMQHSMEADHLTPLRETLLEARNRRVRPFRDDKILTDWNGLMIAALARAYQVFGQHEFLHAAEEACRFILTNMASPEGGLFHRYRDGEAAVPGFLDDYAALVLALVDLYEATFDEEYLERAISLMDFCTAHFRDPERGTFYQSPDTSEPVLIRRTEFFDGAVPSGNALTLYNLLRLGHMTVNSRYLQHADGLARAASDFLVKHPTAYTFFLISLDYLLGPCCEVVVAGHDGSSEVGEMVRAIRRIYAPNKVVLFRPEHKEKPRIAVISPFVEHQRMKNGRTTCYICTDFSCTAPLFSVEDVAGSLQPKEEIT